MAQVKLQNSVNISRRHWVKELPDDKTNKLSNIHPNKIPYYNNRNLNKFRLKGFKNI